MLKKFGESLEIGPANIQSEESVLADQEIHDKFEKFAGELKRVAPKANDFLYFSAVMLHAAEAALINADGTPKLTRQGEPLQASWEKKGESVRWVCNDSNVRPYKNSNGDIFPESELILAYKKWVEKPLCVDHKSSSVDAIRGIILDTYYDRVFKRVVGLCALDKISYPELARKVSTGTSTSVSMGTAVGRAICTDCGTVARTERDFCSHMKSKSCYGEINCDLQPIELSIVVSGADPHARIRTVLAAAETLNKYLDNKTGEINKLAGLEGITNQDVLDKLDELEGDLQGVHTKLSDLKSSLDVSDIDNKNITENAPYGMSSGALNSPDLEVSTQTSLNLPQTDRFASTDFRQEMKQIKTQLDEKLGQIDKSLQKLSTKLHSIKEETMSNSQDPNMNKAAYFQGGGGLNEPTPGKPKYPKDPMNEDLRENGDKQMVGQKPFPDVGSVDGLHPSPDSADPSDELQRKKMLARAETDNRSLRRAAALEKAKENIMNRKEGYFQGGGGLNEPTPHKPKYPKDPMNEDLREDGDKQMVGQKPFPGVGDVDGLHPSPASADEKDELKRKQLLQRASLKARFVKAANTDGTENLGNSAWQIYVDNKLVLTASVNEITGGRVDALYETVATKDFGTNLLGKIREVGLDKAASLYKQAQAVTGMGTQPAAPADAGGAAPVPPMADPMGLAAPQTSDRPMAEDKGGRGDPKEAALALAEEVRDRASDLHEAVQVLTGDQAEMGKLEEMTAASTEYAPLHKMRRHLNEGLIGGMKTAETELKAHESELRLIASLFEDETPGTEDEYVQTVVTEALDDAKNALADSIQLMSAFVKYARGTDGLVKQAEEDSSEEDESSADDSSTEDESSADDLNLNIRYPKDSASSSSTDDASAHDDLDWDLETTPEDTTEEMAKALEMPEEFKVDDVALVMDTSTTSDMNDVMVDLDPKSLEGMQVAKKAEQDSDMTTKEGRAEYRAKLAAQSVEFSKMLDESAKLADGQTQLDVKPSGDLGYVETVSEQHKKDLEVAQAPVKVRKEAERLDVLVKAGKVDVKDFDKLISQGLDPEVVKYWKSYWGQAGKEGSEFAKDLLDEHVKAKAAEEMKSYRVKIARAYDLSNEMVRRGLLADDRHAISAQVDEVMTWNDEAFESMKRVIAKHTAPSFKKLAAIPQVGQIGSGDLSTSTSEPIDLTEELTRAFSYRRY